jgi:hypothetical protein
MTIALQRYLIRSSLLFGGIGLAHGIVLYKLHDITRCKLQEIGAPHKLDKQTREQLMIRYIAGGALFGLLMGPWAPIAGPIWVCKKWPDSRCLYLKY